MPVSYRCPNPECGVALKTPLVNVRGQVVGINTAIVPGQGPGGEGSFLGIGFAIPSNMVKHVMGDLVKTGKVSRGYLGAGVYPVTQEYARQFKVPDTSGAFVQDVTPGGPADKAGLKPGDVVRKFNGQTVDDSGQLVAKVTDTNPGTTVTLDILRDGKRVSVPVTLEEMGSRDKSGETGAPSERKGRWGVGITNITPEIREQLQLPTEVQNGAVIGNVVPGSPADNAGLQQGDVILEVNRKAVKNAEEVKRELAAVPKGEDAMLLVWSRGGSSFRIMHASTE